jgi:hypothetical protein
MNVFSGEFAGQQYTFFVQELEAKWYQIDGFCEEIELRGHLLQLPCREQGALKIHGALKLSNGIALTGVMYLEDDGIRLPSTERKVTSDGHELRLKRGTTLPWEVLLDDNPEVAVKQIEASYVK